MISDWYGRWDFNWFVLAAKPSADARDYVAFLPLQVTTDKNKDGTFRNEIKFGAWDLADAGGLICDPGHEDEAIPALTKSLKGMLWTNLFLKHFSASTKRLRRFTKAFPEQKFEIVEREMAQNAGKTICNIFPYTDLTDTWDAFLTERLSTNTRQKAKRFLKRLDTSDDMRVTHCDPATFAHNLETMLELWKGKWLAGESEWLVSQILQNNRVMLRGAFAAGNLLMPILWQGDRPLCLLAILIDAPRKALRFYIGGRDETFDGPPPGFILHCHTIRWAIANGYKLYDFLQGNEPYKYMFGAKERYVKTLVIRKSTPETKLDPLSLPYVIEEAQKLRKKGKVEQAERLYRQIVESDPSHGPSVLTLARLRMLASDIAEAETLLKNHVALDPRSTPAWLQLGKIQQGLGDLKSASASYRKVLALDPSNAEALRLSREVSPLDDILKAALGDAAPRGPINPIISRS